MISKSEKTDIRIELAYTECRYVKHPERIPREFEFFPQTTADGPIYALREVKKRPVCYFPKDNRFEMRGSDGRMYGFDAHPNIKRFFDSNKSS